MANPDHSLAQRMAGKVQPLMTLVAIGVAAVGAWTFLSKASGRPTAEAGSGQRLATHVGRALDLDQHADALVGAVVLLLALGETLEDRFAHRA